MLLKPTILVVTVLAAFALATLPPQGNTNQCSTGTVQCCNSVQQASNLSTEALEAILEAGARGPFKAILGSVV